MLTSRRRRIVRPFARGHATGATADRSGTLRQGRVELAAGRTPVAAVPRCHCRSRAVAFCRCRCRCPVPVLPVPEPSLPCLARAVALAGSGARAGAASLATATARGRTTRSGRDRNGRGGRHRGRCRGRRRRRGGARRGRRRAGPARGRGGGARPDHGQGGCGRGAAELRRRVRATASAVGVPPVDDAATPLDSGPGAGPAGVRRPAAPPAGPGVVPAGGVPRSGEVAEPVDLAANWGDPVGPEPRFSPATIDSAAAAVAAAATNRLRTKYGLAVVSASGGTSRAGTSGSACPKARDANTSSRVA